MIDFTPESTPFELWTGKRVRDLEKCAPQKFRLYVTHRALAGAVKQAYPKVAERVIYEHLQER